MRAKLQQRPVKSAVGVDRADDIAARPAKFSAFPLNAMPMILTATAEVGTWLSAPWVDAGRRQRPLPDGLLTIVARDAKQDASVELLGSF